MDENRRDASPLNGPKTVAHDDRGRFVKGNQGGGRPSTKWIRDFFATVVELKGDKGARRIERQEAVLQQLFQTAIDRKHKDHVRAAECVLAYVAGKPVAAVEVSGPDGSPLQAVQGMTSEQQLDRIRVLLTKGAAGAAEASDPAGGPGGED